MLLYALHRNYLTEGEDDYTAIPQSSTNKKIEDIIKQITIPGSILKETECVAVIHQFLRAIGTNLGEGTGFISEYLRVNPGFSGVFEGLDDQFDPQRHQLEIHANAGPAWKSEIEAVELQKVDGDPRKPEIKSIYEWDEGSSGRITPNEPFDIFGKMLKVDLAAKDEGVYFVPTGNGQKVYKAAFVRENLPRKVSIRIPKDLPAGAYRLEVRNRIMTNKSLRIGAYEKLLIVK